MRKLIILCAVVLLLSAGAVSAQDESVGFKGWGPRVGLTLDPDQIHFGAHADFGNFAKHLRFQPNFEIGFGDDFTIAMLNAEVNYRFSEKWDVWTPYLGGGVGIAFINHDFPDNANGHGDDTNTEFGASVLGGIEKGLSNGDRFFLEVKLGLVDAPDLKITAGWTFGH